mmetsp:Transcript_82945/g.216135  ORF Transcript_82945/g.216135 Transcript_82945/m.216135 type:complete len:206 (+) Transcript_82945:356-973(+)
MRGVPHLAEPISVLRLVDAAAEVLVKRSIGLLQGLVAATELVRDVLHHRLPLQGVQALHLVFFALHGAVRGLRAIHGGPQRVGPTHRAAGVAAAARGPRRGGVADLAGARPSPVESPGGGAAAAPRRVVVARRRPKRAARSLGAAAGAAAGAPGGRRCLAAGPVHLPLRAWRAVSVRAMSTALTRDLAVVAVVGHRWHRKPPQPT